jgi:hypothetical protein
MIAKLRAGEVEALALVGTRDLLTICIYSWIVAPSPSLTHHDRQAASGRGRGAGAGGERFLFLLLLIIDVRTQTMFSPNPTQPNEYTMNTYSRPCSHPTHLILGWTIAKLPALVRQAGSHTWRSPASKRRRWGSVASGQAASLNSRPRTSSILFYSILETQPRNAALHCAQPHQPEGHALCSRSCSGVPSVSSAEPPTLPAHQHLPPSCQSQPQQPAPPAARAAPTSLQTTNNQPTCRTRSLSTMWRPSSGEGKTPAVCDTHTTEIVPTNNRAADRLNPPPTPCALNPPATCLPWGTSWRRSTWHFPFRR